MSLRTMVARHVSRYLARRPRVLFRIQQAIVNLGYRVLDLRAASWVIRRPEWLLAHSKGVPTSLVPPLSKVLASGDAIARRIVATHSRAKAGESSSAANIPRESMWGTLRQVHYRAICDVVERGDVAALAHYFSEIFRTETVNGYTYGTTFDHMPHRWHYLPVGIELSVVTLAECVGVLRAECHEQGQIAFWRSQLSEDELVERLEAFFGLRIEAPRAGDPRGIMFGGRFISRETCSHLYTAYRMREAINRQALAHELDIVEIGGGYGGTCYWLHKLMPGRVNRYVIVDLPEVSLVQAFFLETTAVSQLVLYGESWHGTGPRIELLPYFRLEEIDFQPNVLINQDSMPEMPESEVERYLEWASVHLNGLFLSFNQESYAPWAGVLQVHVPTVVRRFPRLKRVARETSWDRRGYVEEVYATTVLPLGQPATSK